MGFFRDYRQRRVSLTGPESVATLTAIARFFQDGRNWTQGAYHRLNGNKCLVGAAQSVRQGAIDDAQYYLRQAITELYPGWHLPGMQIESFNDSHSFAEVAEVIERAKQLALAAARPAHVPSAPQILPPPSRPALAHQPEDSVVRVTMADLERVAAKPRK
jgi:hypothetical protein